MFSDLGKDTKENVAYSKKFPSQQYSVYNIQSYYKFSHIQRISVGVKTSIIKLGMCATTKVTNPRSSLLLYLTDKGVHNNLGKQAKDQRSFEVE